MVEALGLHLFKLALELVHLALHLLAHLFVEIGRMNLLKVLQLVEQLPVKLEGFGLEVLPELLHLLL